MGIEKRGGQIPIVGLTLKRTEKSAGRNPYLVISTDRRLITNHNNIDDDRIIELSSSSFLSQHFIAGPVKRTGLKNNLQKLALVHLLMAKPVPLGQIALTTTALKGLWIIGICSFGNCTVSIKRVESFRQRPPCLAYKQSPGRSRRCDL